MVIILEYVYSKEVMFIYTFNSINNLCNIVLLDIFLNKKIIIKISFYKD